MNNKAYLFFFALLLAIGVFYLYQKYRVAPSLDLNKLSLRTLDNQAFDMHQLEGKKVAMLMAASWCPNCIEELNDLASVNSKDLGDIYVVVVSDEPIEKILFFKSKFQFPFVFLKLDNAFSSIGIASIPTAYLFNKQLKVVKQAVGAIHWSDPSTLNHLKSLMD